MKLATLIVHAGEHERWQCLVETAITLDQDVPCENLVLWDESEGKNIPVQAWTEKEGQINLAWIVDRMARQDARTFELRVNDEPVASNDGVRLQERPGKLEVLIAGKHLTTYNYDQVVRPYLYPVFVDEGVGITRNWPMVQDVPEESTDHPHHKGIYTAQDGINGVNNWGEGQGHGWQVHKRFSRTFGGSIAGGFTAELDWTDQNRHVYMTETRQITFYNTPPQARFFDYQVTLHASKGDLVIGDTKEGGLIAVRVACSMEEQRESGGTIVNGLGGAREAETWGKRAQWCDYSGPIGSKQYGICLIDHPQNPRFPTFWHVRAYGLMTANCFGRHDFTGDPGNRWDMPVAAGESRTWRYRILLHHGDARAAQVPTHYESFAYPPSVDIKYL
ncbi:MAG: PmoA family protein [Anaerolineae bacterium]|nr:PmoA family protein [Anaerolineae bacterium]